MRTPLLLLSLLALAACGGGGGGGGSSGGGGSPSTDALGSREVPGGTVTVYQPTASTLRIAATLTGVASVEVFRGDDYASALPVTLTTAPEGGWTGSAASGSHLLVRMTMTDGSVVETAPGDFNLR